MSQGCTQPVRAAIENDHGLGLREEVLVKDSLSHFGRRNVLDSEGADEVPKIRLTFNLKEI